MHTPYGNQLFIYAWSSDRFGDDFSAMQASECGVDGSPDFTGVTRYGFRGAWLGKWGRNFYW